MRRRIPLFVALLSMSKMPECLFAHDGKVGKAQHFLKGREGYLRNVSIHVDAKHLQKKVASALSISSWAGWINSDEKYFLNSSPCSGAPSAAEAPAPRNIAVWGIAFLSS